jgi:hypothetical protein
MKSGYWKNLPNWRINTVDILSSCIKRNYKYHLKQKYTYTVWNLQWQN